MPEVEGQGRGQDPQAQVPLWPLDLTAGQERFLSPAASAGKAQRGGGELWEGAAGRPALPTPWARPPEPRPRAAAPHRSVTPRPHRPDPPALPPGGASRPTVPQSRAPGFGRGVQRVAMGSAGFCDAPPGLGVGAGGRRSGRRGKTPSRRAPGLGGLRKKAAARSVVPGPRRRREPLGLSADGTVHGLRPFPSGPRGAPTWGPPRVVPKLSSGVLREE